MNKEYLKQIEYKADFSQSANNIPSSFIRDILKVASEKGTISFAGGLPDSALFPAEELGKYAAEALKSSGKSLLQYSRTEGYMPLVRWICSFYEERYHMKVHPEEVLITNGAQQALDLSGRAFLDPGDKIVLEQPAYLGAVQSYSALRPDILSIPVMQDGIDIHSLEVVLRGNRPKLLYLVPNFQNPTGYTISFEKRARLAELSEEYGFYIIEDDPYGLLRFEGKELYPLRKYTKRSVICGSLSKVVAPGLRIGWMIAERKIIKKMLVLKQASDLHSTTLNQYIAERFLNSEYFHTHIQKITQEYHSKAFFMYELIKHNFPEGTEVKKPEGGMFLWVKLPDGISADELLRLSSERKIVFVPGNYFYTNGKGSGKMRLNFTNSSKDDIYQGIMLLSELCTDMMKQGGA